MVGFQLTWGQTNSVTPMHNQVTHKPETNKVIRYGQDKEEVHDGEQNIDLLRSLTTD